jgi:replicative DNA helicase
VGKTTFCIVLAVGACRHHQDNDAVAIFLSLDMYRDEIMTRLDCNLSGLDWATINFGSAGLRNRQQGPWFHEGHLRQLREADQQLREQQIDRRLLVHDWTTLSPDITSDRLVAMLGDLKSQVGASRALLIVDYLQKIGVPDEVSRRGELEADRHRIQILKDVIAKTRTNENPNGDTVLAISEARKPASSKDSWGTQMSELMGSARLAYAPDAVFLYRPATEKDVTDGLFNPGSQAPGTFLRSAQAHGMCPVVITLAKGRDGMRRGDTAMVFEFERSRFSEARGIDLAALDEDGDSPADSGPDLPPPARGQGPLVRA